MKENCTDFDDVTREIVSAEPDTPAFQNKTRVALRSSLLLYDIIDI